MLALVPALASPAASLVEKPTGLFASASGSTIWSHPDLRGVLIRASWSSVEPSPGSFDFSALRTQIAAVKSHGKPYSLAIGAGGPGSPGWLIGTLGSAYFDYSFRGTPMRLPLFWSPIVKERLGLLAARLGQELADDPDLKLVYVTQMTANGIEGHLNGVDMNAFAKAGYTDDAWVEAALATAERYASAFPGTALAFEVHELNGSAAVPGRILDALGSEARFGGRVGAAIWWVSGRTDYQAALLSTLKSFRGDLYGQVIARSDQGSQFANGDYRTVFAQAKELGLRYLEPWEFDFGTGAGTADGAWNDQLRDFNAWADARASTPSRWLVPSSARAPGAGGSLFTTDLVVANTGDGEAAVTLRFLGHDVDGRSGKTASLVIPAGASRTLADVLGSVFGESEAHGAILVSSSVPSLVVVALTSTPQGVGSYGQSVPAFGASDRLAAGARWSIAGVREDAAFRTNLVLASAAEVAVNVEVTLVGEDGATLGRKSYALPPLGMTQVTRVVRDLGPSGNVQAARLVLTTDAPEGTLAAYAALIDAATNDPRTLLPR